MTRTLHVRLTWFVAGLLLILSAGWLALRLAAVGDQRMAAYGVLFD